MPNKEKLKKYIKIADKIKLKISKLLLKEFKELENKGKHIINIDDKDQTISLDYLNKHIFRKLKKGDININVTDLKKGRFQISLPHIETTEFDHLYVLPEVRENVFKSLSDDEKKYLGALDLLRMKEEEENNLKMSKEFSFWGVSANTHLKKIEEINEQLEDLTK